MNRFISIFSCISIRKPGTAYVYFVWKCSDNDVPGHWSVSEEHLDIVCSQDRTYGIVSRFCFMTGPILPVLVFGCCSAISYKTSCSTSERFTDIDLSSRLVSLSLKRLNQFYTKRSETVPESFTSLIPFATTLAFSPFFLHKQHEMALITTFHHPSSKL